MNSWPPGTRNRLVFVLLVGVGVLMLIWFGVGSPLQARLKIANGKADLARMQLQLAQAGQDKGPYYRAMVEERTEEMKNLESTMAETPNVLGWAYGTMTPYFKVHNITASTWDRTVLSDVDVPPEVPYQLATIGVSGMAHFHAFGKFLADFENSFPFMKVKSVTLQTVAPGFVDLVQEPEDQERLRFRLEYQILALPLPKSGAGATNTVATR